MRKAKFITDRRAPARRHNVVTGVYNGYERIFEPHDGILNVKRELEFDAQHLPCRILLRSTALGVYDLYWNGKRVGEKVGKKTACDELKPGWTDYRFRVFSYEYEISEIQAGRQILVAMISPGWWSGRVSYGIYGYQPCAFAAEIELFYSDGSTEIIATDEDGWETAVAGPVLRADHWDGEYYDGRIPSAAVCPAAHAWETAELFDGFSGEIVSPVGPPVRVTAERLAEQIRLCGGVKEDGSKFGSVVVLQTADGAFREHLYIRKGQSLILDFAQNMVGRPRITVRARRGTKIEIFFAEMLNDKGESGAGNDGPKGSLYLSNYRSAYSRVVYIASGEGEESYAPLHSFFGFRYLEIRTDGDAEICFVKAEVLGSDVGEISHFTCDNAEINRLYENAVWGMRSNYLSVPTDCPQRDERLGWTGDTQVFHRAASYMADIDGFMRKWLGDARDSQRGFRGAYCDIIPRITNDDLSGAAWADAALIVPYRLWLMYGDKAVIAEHYDSMEAYMTYLEQYGLEGPRDTYGDWLAPADTDKRYISVCYYAYDAYLMKEYSRILGKEKNEQYYYNLFERIRQHWQKRYLADGYLTVTTQTGYLLAFAFDLLPEERKQEEIARLRDRIVADQRKLTTGFIGTGMILSVLSRLGLDDLCYDLLLQTDCPSWLYSVKQGATTMWERWNSYTLDRGFGDVTMNSFNHYAYGAVAEWFFSGMGGILPSEEHHGFDACILAPTPDLRKEEEIPTGQKRICRAEVTYPSVKGKISSAWVYRDGEVTYRMTIPQGMTAEIKLLGTKARLVGYAGEVLQDGDRITFEITGGTYEFRMLKEN